MFHMREISVAILWISVAILWISVAHRKAAVWTSGIFLYQYIERYLYRETPHKL